MNSRTPLLAGRRILVTGAARGLGLAFAKELSEAGASVVLADVQQELLTSAVRTLQDEGRDAHAVFLDLASPESIQSCVQEAASKLGGLDGLVNNAAVTNSGGRSLSEIDVDVWDGVMQINVRGTWLMSQACLPYLKSSSCGAIVNLASDTPLWGAPKLLAYVASKGAVIAMTRSMARELGEFGITVNSVAPGLTLVEATQYIPEDRHQLYINQRALHREQLPEDVSGSVVYLLSDWARFVTGQLLVVNGGFSMN